MKAPIRYFKDGYEVLVNAEDRHWLEEYSWHIVVNHTGLPYVRFNYARKNGSYAGKRFHRVIINAPNHVLVDHSNLNSLDNRRENLRMTDNGKNKANGLKYTCRNGSLSCYKGVTVDRNSYRAQIRVNKKHISLGYFPLTSEGEIEAAKAYDRAARQYFGEFARCNYSESEG